MICGYELSKVNQMLCKRGTGSPILLIIRRVLWSIIYFFRNFNMHIIHILLSWALVYFTHIHNLLPRSIFSGIAYKTWTPCLPEDVITELCVFQNGTLTAWMYNHTGYHCVCLVSSNTEHHSRCHCLLPCFHNRNAGGAYVWIVGHCMSVLYNDEGLQPLIGCISIEIYGINFTVSWCKMGIFMK